MTTTRERERRGAAFRDLHRRDRAFLLPNPWDVGSARLLEALGFEALATTSSGFAWSLGRTDGRAGRDATIAHVAELAAAVALPLSADLENGFGDEPGTVAETIRLAGEAGAAGGSIEDFTGRPGEPIYPVEAAVERIRAAAAAARALDAPFTLTARAENFLHGRPDLDDTIRRLAAYAEAGADVVYAPGLATREQIAAVVGAVDRPVNVLAGLPAMRLDLDALSQLGVRRVSVGGALARAALAGFLDAARELRERGTFGFVAGAARRSADVDRLLESGEPPGGRS